MPQITPLEINPPEITPQVVTPRRGTPTRCAYRGDNPLLGRQYTESADWDRRRSRRHIYSPPPPPAPYIKKFAADTDAAFSLITHSQLTTAQCLPWFLIKAAWATYSKVKSLINGWAIYSGRQPWAPTGIGVDRAVTHILLLLLHLIKVVPVDQIRQLLEAFISPTTLQ